MQGITSEDLANRFKFHPASTPERVQAHENIRAHCHRLAEFIRATVPAGREQALAITHLEDAMMWANAGIARQPIGTEPTVHQVEMVELVTDEAINRYEQEQEDNA